MPISRSSKAFLERAGIKQTHRYMISPKLDLTNLKAYSLRLKPPLPVPSLVLIDNGTPPPDRPASKDWPWPETTG